jgi:hypothetical protein
VAVGEFWDPFLTRRAERVHVNRLVKNGAGERGKKGGSFSRGWRLRFSSSYVKGFVKLRAGRSGKTVIRLRDSLKTRWVGKSGQVNEFGGRKG